MNTDTYGGKASAPITARWRWTARGAFLAALAAIVLPLMFAGLRSLALLVLGVAGVTIAAAGAWWAVARRGVRRAIGLIVAVVMLLGVVIVYALARFLLIAILSVALLVLAGFMARAALRACARPVREYETAPPAHPFIIMNPRSGGGKVVGFQLVERAEALGARVTLLGGDQTVDVVALARQAVADGTWPCDREEPPYLAPSYRWVLVLEALQAARRDGQDGRHPRSADWEQAYGRGIPGPDGASQLAAVTRWHAAAQRDPAQLRAVAWGRRTDPALERAAGAKAGDHDWTERVACHLDVFVQPCRWPLDYLTSPGSVQPQE